ncbi:hypothetical protein ABPG72_009529 [Tetrahymena utriculariae]
MTNTIDEFTKGVMIGLKLSNMNSSQAEKILLENGMKGSRQSIDRYWEEFSQKGLIVDKRSGRCGRKPKIDSDSGQIIKNHVINNPLVSKQELENNKAVNTKEVTGQTIANYLNNENFTQKKVKKVIFLSENSKIQRVSWAKKLLRNQKIALRNAVYTDETIIEFQNTRTQYQWVNGNGKQSEIKQEIKRWPQKVMIWAAIHMSGPIDIQIIEKNLNEEEYIKILTKFTNKTKDLNLQFFQQDNAPCHSTKKVLEFFKKNNKILLEWAPYSPDVNPIEKVWNILKQNLAKQISTCQDFQEYKQKCISIFETDKKVFGCIQQSIKNIPKILQQIIDSRGEITQ